LLVFVFLRQLHNDAIVPQHAHLLTQPTQTQHTAPVTAKNAARCTSRQTPPPRSSIAQIHTPRKSLQIAPSVPAPLMLDSVPSFALLTKKGKLTLNRTFNPLTNRTYHAAVTPVLSTKLTLDDFTIDLWVNMGVNTGESGNPDAEH
jgi:hypothetical protein